MQILTDSDILPNDPTAQRLRGTVWQDVQLAHVGYSLISALGRALARAGISANALTILALALSAAAGVAVATGHLWGATTLVLVGGVFDALDGVVARATGTSSRWGALLDSTVDRFADAFPLIGVASLYLVYDRLALIPVGALVFGFGVSYVRARAEALGTQLPALFMRRPERTILLLCCLALGTVDFSPVVPHALLLAGVGILGVMNAIGVIAALSAARRALSAKDDHLG